eukprot:c18145_g1_i2 orf=91-1344(+)
MLPLVLMNSGLPTTANGGGHLPFRLDSKLVSLGAPVTLIRVLRKRSWFQPWVVYQHAALFASCKRSSSGKVLRKSLSNFCSLTEPTLTRTEDTMPDITASIEDQPNQNTTDGEPIYRDKHCGLQDMGKWLQNLGVDAEIILCLEAYMDHAKNLIIGWMGEGIIITFLLFSFIMGTLLLVDLYMSLVSYQNLVPFLHAPFLFVASIAIRWRLTSTFLVSATIAGLFGCLCIPLLRTLKAYQIFRKEGPSSHFAKAGTPTMGGIFFVPIGVGIAIGFSGILTGVISKELCTVATVTLAFTAIGLLDDVLALIHSHNYGLPGWLKLALQVAVAIVFCFWLESSSLLSDYQLKFPLPLDPWDIGKLYYPLTVFCFAAMSNGINLTDGLDGLAGGTAAAAFLGMTIAVIPQYTVFALTLIDV